MAAITGFILDLDGVVYCGSTPIEGAVAAINLMSSWAEVLFMTNNSTRSRADYIENLSSLGIDMSRCSVITSSSATARYCAQEGYSRVLVIGEKGLTTELEGAGIQMVEHDADAVVVGLDRGFTYDKMARALKELLRGAAFIATNPDPTLPSEEGLLPGNGAQVAALERACGRTALVVGKPSARIMDIALAQMTGGPEQLLVVGDRLDTDIQAGIGAGTRTCLVLSGATTTDDLASSSIHPDLVAPSLAELPSLLADLD